MEDNNSKCSCCGKQILNDYVILKKDGMVCLECDNSSKMFPNAEPTVKDKKDCIIVMDKRTLEDRVEYLENFQITAKDLVNLPCKLGAERIDKLEEDIKGLRKVIIELQAEIEILKSDRKNLSMLCRALSQKVIEENKVALDILKDK